MQTVKTIQKPINGQLLIQVPEEFHDMELEIIILPAPALHEEQEVDKRNRRLEMVAHLKGSLPNRPYSKADHYLQ